jgi:hypothetical protein
MKLAQFKADVLYQTKKISNVCDVGAQTKRPAGQNVRRDKTFGQTKCLVGQNVRWDKTSGDQTSFFTYIRMRITTVYLVSNYIFRNLHICILAC